MTSSSKPVALVVDDEAMIRSYASNLLGDLGFAVLEAGFSVSSLMLLLTGIRDTARQDRPQPAR